MVITGLERALKGDTKALRGRRVGLIANPTTVTSERVHAVDRFAADPAIDLRRLFGPEHGLRGDAQDMIAVGTEDRDARTGLPVFSLYGHTEASLKPTRAMLDGLDVLVFDVQDVGARYYTYIWTMVLAMRACAEAGIALVVLDRPNPLGGLETDVEGGAVAPECESFVGLCSVPVRHGLTSGEIATWMRAREGLDVELDVVTMQGWQRDMYYEDTGLPWILPSPNMPTMDTALVYPGMCLVEGTELSEGRGTTRPFELCGAPFIDGYALAEELERYQLPGVHVRPHAFTPMFQKHARTLCRGVQFHVTDRRAFRPYRTGVGFLRAVRALWPESFAWRERAYEFVADIPAIDLLAGSCAVREGIESGAELAELAATWADSRAALVQERREHLLYE